jgi:hypothetical protein
MAEGTVFHDSVTPLPDKPGHAPRGLIVAAAEPDPRKEQMTVLFSLEIPSEKTADLEECVARGEVVSPDELQRNYAPNAADRDKLVKWLKTQGFDVTGMSHDGTSVYARLSKADREGWNQLECTGVAGFCALLNESRSKARKPFLPFLNPLLYPLQGTACFRDIRVGNNGDFSAGPGYDLVTGLGVPNVKELMKALT